MYTVLAVKYLSNLRVGGLEQGAGAGAEVTRDSGEWRGLWVVRVGRTDTRVDHCLAGAAGYYGDAGARPLTPDDGSLRAQLALSAALSGPTRPAVAGRDSPKPSLSV